MLVGINRWTMPPDWPLRQCFDEAARAGFDTIEINIAEEGELTPATDSASLRSLADAARAAGVAISSVSSGLGWKYPLTHPDDETRRRGVSLVEAGLRAASEIGVDTLLCVPGVVTPEVRYDTAYERSLEALRELAPVAESLGVAVGVENVWNKFLLSPLEMARFIDEAGSRGVGAYFDAGNVLVTGYPAHWIHILGSRIRKVHVKDFRNAVGNITGFANPLQGDLPWAGVRAALEATGYSGPITAEVEGYPAYPRLGLAHIAQSLRAVFE